MEPCFQTELRKLAVSPNQRIWWHAMPLPDGSRIDSVTPIRTCSSRCGMHWGSVQEGISNYLFPNEAAMLNLAPSYDFDCRMLDGSHNACTLENPTRRMFRFTRR